MTRCLATLALLAALPGCVFPTYVDTRPLALSDDLTVHTVTSATCSRGNSPFEVTVEPDGSTSGRLIQPKPPRGAPRPEPITVPVTLVPKDKRTVTLTLAEGKVTSDAVSEDLSPALWRGDVILRGESFDCADVQVRA